MSVSQLHTPFSDNTEYLEAKREEMTLLIECASLRRAIEVVEAQHPNGNDFLRKHGPRADGAEKVEPGRQVSEMKKALEEKVRKYEAVRLENEGRLALPRGKRFPFEDLVEQCRLTRFEQDVVWLLFFKAVSPDFRQKYEDGGLNTVGHETHSELYIGNLLQILCPGSLREQLEARRYFSVDAPLLRHHLVKLGRAVEDCATILEVELELPQRVIGWITEDSNTYVVDSPFHVECPETSLSQVVLPQEHIDRVLALLENHDAYVEKRRELRLDETISYGRAIVILEYGPPGTGKTLLARALSNHTGRPLVSFKERSDHGKAPSYTSFAENVPKLFREAQLRRGIVFIDECEQFCLKDSEELRYLLIELERTDAIVIMATNRPEELAPALDRRLTLKIPFQMPDAAQRRRIWEAHIPENVPLAEDVDLEVLARRTPGFSGADLANMVNEAALLAARRDREKIPMADCEDSIERVVAGPERKSRIISEQEKKVLAHHEVGHAVLAELLPRADPVHKVSILQRGLALGYTLQLPSEDRYIMSRSELLDRITVFLGGRVSEELVFQESSTGAADDLKKATDLARRMVTDFGMSEALGPISLGRKYEQPFLGRDLMEDRNYSEQVASAIDKELATIIEDCYQRAKQLLTEHSDKVRSVVEVVLDRETLSGDEIRAIMRGEELPAPEKREPEAPSEETVSPPAPEAESPPPVAGEQPHPA